MIAKWIARQELPRLAELWVKGLALDWKAFHAVPPRRLALPQYPFARERYWIDDADVLFQSDRATGLSRYLLTMLDGLESESAGKVAVILTAMNPNHLPPALLRSGRVELWLETRLPAQAARARHRLERQSAHARQPVELERIARQRRAVGPRHQGDVVAPRRQRLAGGHRLQAVGAFDRKARVGEVQHRRQRHRLPDW